MPLWTIKTVLIRELTTFQHFYFGYNTNASGCESSSSESYTDTFNCDEIMQVPLASSYVFVLA